MQQANVTLTAKADTGPEAMAKMLEAFAPYGVTKEHIEKRIQRRLDAIQPAQVVSLKRIYASLRDDMSTPAEWFDMGEAPPPAEAAASLDAVRAAAAAKRGKPAATPAPATQPQRPATKTLADYRTQVENATDGETAALALDAARDDLDATDYGLLTEFYRASWGAK